MSSQQPSTSTFHTTPRMHHQQLKHHIHALQTTFQTYTHTPTTTTLTQLLPPLQHHITHLTLHSHHLTPPLLLPALPTLCDVLDALLLNELPLHQQQVQPLASDVLRVLVWWTQRATRWLAAVDDKSSTVYEEVAYKVRDSYVRLGSAAEQWTAAVTLTTAVASAPPALSALLPPLLTLLCLSSPYMSAAHRDSSMALLISSLASPTTATALLASPQTIDLLNSLPSTVTPSTPYPTLLSVTTAVLSLWRLGGATDSVVRPYDEYKALMSYMAAVTTLAKDDTAAITQLQHMCTTSATVTPATTTASVASLSLVAVYGMLGMLIALDPKAAAYKHHRAEVQKEKPKRADDESDGSSRVNDTASSSSPSAVVTNDAASKPSAERLTIILSLQSTFQSAIDQLLSTCSSSSSSSTAALSTISTPPTFAASLCGVLSAACVSGIEWLHYTDTLFHFITTALLTLVDTRWSTTPTTLSLSLSAASSSLPATRNTGMQQWVRSSFFALLPHYSRAFAVLFVGGTAEQQAAALSRVRHATRHIHRLRQHYNQRINVPSRQQQPPTAMDQDTTADTEDDTSADTDTSTTTTLPAATTHPPALDRHTLSQLQNTLFLSIVMSLATVVCQPHSQPQPSQQQPAVSVLAGWSDEMVCDVVDTMSWLEFVRVNFTGYRDVLEAVVTEGVRRSSTAAQPSAKSAVSGEDKRSGWVRWLVGWRLWHARQDRPQRMTEAGEEKRASSQQASGLVNTFVTSYLLPSLNQTPPPLTSPVAPPTTSPSPFSSTLLTPLLPLDESDLVSLSRHYFLLGLLSEWQDGSTSQLALSTLLPYSLSFLHCRSRGVLKRAHGLFVRSLALIARHHTLHSTPSRQSTDADDGYAVVLSVLLPYVRLVLSQYPEEVKLDVLMDSLVLLFHLLPANHPLLLTASHAIVARIQQLYTQTTRATLTTQQLSVSSLLVTAGDSGSGEVVLPPTVLRHLLILHFQLVQLLSLPLFRAALQYTGDVLFPVSVTSGSGSGNGGGGGVSGAGLYGGMLCVLRDVIVRNFDLYRRDEAVRWWMTVKQRTGVVLAAPGPPPPLPVTAPSITTVKATT